MTTLEIRDFSKQIIDNSEKFSEVMSVCSNLLKHDRSTKKYRDYLKEERGIYSFCENGFSFGYFPPNDQLHKLTDKISPEVLEELGLAYNKYVYFSGQPEKILCGTLHYHNLIMPYKNVYGDIIGLVGRTLLSSVEQKNTKISKYKNTSLIKSLNLFGMNEAKKSIIENDSVIIVEGQFDCISCHSHGITNVVALGGAAFSKYHLYLILRYTNNIRLLLDNDDAGSVAMNGIIERFGNCANFSTIKLPKEYKDIDEYLRNCYYPDIF